MRTEVNYCSIVQEQCFEEPFDRLVAKYPRFHEVHSAIDWALGRDPRLGETIGDDEHRLFVTTPIGAMPAFWVLYRFEESQNEVCLVSINALDEDNGS